MMLARNTDISQLPAFILALLIIHAGIACDGGAVEGEPEGASARVSDEPVACRFESDCEYMGPGHMCMDGMCMGMDVLGPVVHQPPATQPIRELVALEDLDPRPDVFEATLVASTAQLSVGDSPPTEVFAYRNGMHHPALIPGPLIDVEVGTLVKIHFTNLLPEPTSVHWHGLRLPNAMDGVAGVTQAPVQPGESYLYEFRVLDPALFWYHPHFRSDVQVERGLYGLFRVRDVAEPEVNVERLFALDDVLLDENGNIMPPDETGAHYFEPGRGMMMTFVSMMGRQGNRLLVNGQANPIITVQPGHIERWRFANTSNSRFFKLALENHNFTLIGVDGGLIPQPERRYEILVPNSERVDLLVRFDGEPGSSHRLLSRHHDRGHDMADPGELPLALIQYAATPAADPLPVPVTTREIEWLPNLEPTTHLRLGERLGKFDKVEFTINDAVWPEVEPNQGTQGEYEVWEIENETHMDHPFHLHGMFFQPLARSSGKGERLQWIPFRQPMWKDTVTVPGESRLRFGILYDGFPGDWVYHCHIFEHAHAGMMGRMRIDANPDFCRAGQTRCVGNFLESCDVVAHTFSPAELCALACVEKVAGLAHCELPLAVP